MTMYNEAFGDAVPFSDTTAQIALAASTALTYTVPGNNQTRYRCKFSWAYNANVWVGYNVTATVPPGGAVTSGGNLELRPDIKYVKGGDVLSFISDSLVSDASLSLLQLPN